MKSSYYLDTLRGRSQELPAVRSKVVRVFISSTFTDTLVERDSLIENIFPKLKDYCREKYGLEFQYADMRWGIQTESVNNHGEVATCLKEIELCKKYSVATNFVVLLSHRYGSRPIPAEIPATLFDLLKSTIFSEQNENDDGKLMMDWYRLDTNAVPASYILQDISSILPNFVSSNPDEVKQADKQWKNINNRLRQILRRAAAICLERGQITESDYDQFFVSVTEKEIINGILNAPDANERTLCFLREISDVREHLSDEKAPKFIDLISHNTNEPATVDDEAEKLLNRLKHVRIPAALKATNIFKYRVRWETNGIHREKHASYISEFNTDFYKALKEQIDRCCQQRFNKGINSVQHEVLEHAIQCKAYVSKFHGRIDVLAELQKYVEDQNEQRPCIVYGDSGCGKTSVLAKTATEVFKWWSTKSVSVILRFLGTTPASSTIYKTLLSISQQICEIYQLKMTVYQTPNQLRDQLEFQLAQIPDDEYLLILLDSIDQLHTDAYDCKWLIDRFPSNVKCIVSTLPDHGNIFKNLQNIFENSPNLFVRVAPFEPSTVQFVYDDWLKMKNRSFSEEQRLFINDLMKKRDKILPLFMKLVFDIVSIWRSYDKIDARLNDLRDVDDCIRYLFHRLEVFHHKILFSRALCYMTACRSGISQNELEDVLSLDDDVLKSVFQHYIPPVRRVPGILWTRIRNDLDEYITEKEIDDAPVIYWYHRRFIEVARELYISNLNEDQLKRVFQNVVDLFKETWKGKDKPIKIDDPKLLNKYKLDQSDGEISANRLTTSQPIEFIDVDGRVQYNKRKLNELPLFLSQLEPEIAIQIAGEEIFFNYAFMHAKFASGSYLDIQKDIEKFQDISTFRLSLNVQNILKEMKVLNMAYLLFGLILNSYPDNYAFEITSRLLILASTQPNISKLIKQCDELSPRHCSLIVPYFQMQPPGNGLLYSMNKHVKSVVDFDFVNNQTAAISLSDKIIVIDMRSGNTALELKLPKIDEPYLNSTTMPKMIVRALEKQLSDEMDDSAESFDNSDDHDEERFKQYVFFVNSAHHIYLISSHGDVKFSKSSSVGFSTVEVLNRRYGFCVLHENNSSTIECWSVGENKVYCTMNLLPTQTVKKIFCSSFETNTLLTVLLTDGTILFYAINQSQFEHRGTVLGGKHLDQILVEENECICTYDNSVPIDFAHIDLSYLYTTNALLSDDVIEKTLIRFDPPINQRPFKRLVLPERQPDSKQNSDGKLNASFIAQTDDALYVVHKCFNKHMSYLRLPGSYDLVTTTREFENNIYAAKGGTIDVFKWKCYSGDDYSDDSTDIFHRYQLFVSIDISSSFVTNIKPADDSQGLFLCSMENGTINAYHVHFARESLKTIPPFPRTTELIQRMEFCKNRVITLDSLGKELSVWSYQNSTSIDSERKLTSSSMMITDFTALSAKAVAVITATHCLEIYPANSLHADALFRLSLRQPGRLLSFDDRSLIVLTTDGFIRCIVEQTEERRMKFSQASSTQLDIKCSNLFGSVLTLNSKRAVVFFADDTKSLVIWTIGNVIPMNIDLSKHNTARLKRLISEKEHGTLLMHFENKFLMSCQIKLSQGNSYELTPYDKADLYDLKNDCLTLASNGEKQLNVHKINESVCHEPIPLEDECEQLCLNQSATYVFTLVKPRILLMHRVNDRRQLARLFVYDHVTTMKASNDFIVLAMNDRRLLTLMIADPDDPQLKSKIEALPSRKHEEKENVTSKKILEQMENFMEMSSDDYESHLSSEDEQENFSEQYRVKKVAAPKDSYRFIHRFNGRHSLTKMKSEQRFRDYYFNFFLQRRVNNVNDVYDESEDEPVNTGEESSKQNNEENLDLEDIRRKTLEHDQQQLKGIQFANAGSNNLKIINNHSVTAKTCSVM